MAEKLKGNKPGHGKIELLSDYACEIHYHPGKGTVVADALSRKDREPLRVKSLVMMIHTNILEKILEARTEAMKEENVEAENLGRSHQKSYADVRRKPMKYDVGDMVMLKVLPWKGVFHFGKRELPEKLHRIHNTFHVSNLKKCLEDENLVIPLEEIQLDDKLHFIEEPVEIIDREVKQLKQSRILIVKPSDLWERIQLLMQGTSLTKQERECKLYGEFDKHDDDPIDAINHMMSFLTSVITSRYPTTNNQLRNLSNPRQQATINDERVTLQPVQGRQTTFVDFEKRFIPQTKLSADQAFWSQNPMNSVDRSPSCRPTKVEVPKEFPKVSMVNTSLKKLKHHLAGFDMVVKERTTATAITEGWCCPMRNRDYASWDLGQMHMGRSGFSFGTVPVCVRVQERAGAVKNDLRKLKGKALVNDVVISHTIAPEMLKVEREFGQLQPKSDIGIFIAYAPTKKAFQIYNRRTRRIIETTHVDFDELTAMASKHSSSEPALHEITPATISSGLVPNPPPSTPVDPSASKFIALIAEVLASEPTVLIGSPSSTTVDQDVPSPNVIPNVVHTAAPNSEHVIKWTKDHPLENIIEYQLADIFTKALGRERIEFLINKLGMRSFLPETLKTLANEAEE
nr:putative reverse transcriptase domain-containing protein [Tanacetum cinerariifolium]